MLMWKHCIDLSLFKELCNEWGKQPVLRERTLLPPSPSYPQTKAAPFNCSLITSAGFFVRQTRDGKKKQLHLTVSGKKQRFLKVVAACLPALWMLGLPWRVPPHDHRLCFCFGFWLLSIVRRTTASWRSLNGIEEQMTGSNLLVCGSTLSTVEWEVGSISCDLTFFLTSTPYLKVRIISIWVAYWNH